MSTINPQYIIDEIHDDLFGVGIFRTDAQIDQALQGAVEHEAELSGFFAPAESIRASEAAWHDLMHRPFGVLDLLEIDSEDTLYDRLAGMAVAA
ncbi:MAG: hypothetical protein BGN98_13765 [Microbacterium sp. 69-7]|uniref:hypothetical protein n=1 Tax=Microbacterium sp. 69-7 TaxID=1895784 RepID=UPI00096167C7|nr:hypothetical protein [Microbacterium sp. 69-7]OJU44447.1 MAG: hypothetical protein BGN98_13765 [Microbacterium sp. 69-7]